CPSPLCLHYAVVATPALAAVAPYGRQPPCHPCRRATGSRPLRPSRGWLCRLLLAAAPAALATAGRPYKGAGHGLPPL
ncbi:hypothetical protein GW17_00057738, partial [Ensete ventricosum]